jgi:hypothetical protein
VLPALVASLAGPLLLPPATLALNPERHYEMVTPLFKGGYGATLINGVAADGESLAFYSEGAFEGAPAGSNLGGVTYLARRGTSQWSTAPIMAPATLIAEPQASDITPSMDLAFYMGHPGPNTYHSLSEEQDLFVHPTATPDTSAGWELGGVLKPPAIINEQFRPLYKAASLAFCHVLLRATGSEAPVPEALRAANQLYDIARGCGDGPKSLALVGVNNRNPGKLMNPACRTTIGGEEYIAGGTTAFNAVSADGGEVFFTVCTKTSGQEFGPDVPHQVFVRLGGSRTLEVSRPLEAGQPFGGCVGEGPGKVAGEVPCEGATARASSDFRGASRDGSRVFFTTAAALTGDDEDSKSDLYLARIGCPGTKPGCAVAEREVMSLTLVSHDPSVGQAAEVQGVVRVAPDGSRVYFVARGVLTSEPGPEGHTPVNAADNLYVYDAGSGKVGFVGDLCSGSLVSGSVEDARCPSPAGVDTKLWTDEESHAQTAGLDGRFLVFATFAQLLSGDSNVAKDVYRYDAQTGRLDRVSGGENGFDDNGNRLVLDEQGEALGASIAPGHYGGALMTQYEMDNRAVSEDGSRVVFTSAEPLSPNATNGLENAYEWQEGTGRGDGSVSLISTGSSEDPVNFEHVTISPSGNDIFFVTTQGLAGQDTDGLADVYDARIGAGFPAPPVPPQSCSGDACQGPLTNPAPLLAVGGSAAQAPGENLPPPGPSATHSRTFTRAEQLSQALRVCRKKRSRSRSLCERQAHKRLGSRSFAKKGPHR